MELSIGAGHDHAIVALRGEFDFTCAADTEAALTALAARGGETLIADMSALDFMDCGMLGVLLRVQMLARQAGGDLVLAAPQRRALRILALTGKGEAFAVYLSVQAAVAGTGQAKSKPQGGTREPLPASPESTAR